MSPLQCALARPLIVASVFDGRPMGPRVKEHRDGCLRCQATEARSRATGRSLRKLELVTADAPAGLTQAVRAGIDQPVEHSGEPRPYRLAFAVVVGIAGFLVAVRRLKRP
jgi:hypothetical protein